MEDLQQEELPTEPSLDSFRDLLAQTFYDLPDAVKQEAFTDSPHSKEAAAAHSGRSDVEQRRDAVPGLTTAGTSGQQASHPSSGAGSEQGTSSSQHQHDHGPGRGRGRGRRSKRVAGQQETAQQRAHRRFYERKKQKVITLITLHHIWHAQRASAKSRGCQKLLPGCDVTSLAFCSCNERQPTDNSLVPRMYCISTV